MLALMILEGIGIITDLELSIAQTASLFAKEFMLRRKGNSFPKHLRQAHRTRDRQRKIE